MMPHTAPCLFTPFQQMPMAGAGEEDAQARLKAPPPLNNDRERKVAVSVRVDRTSPPRRILS